MLHPLISLSPLLLSLPAVTAFLVGGLGFALVDRLLSKSGSSMAQFLAMMMDYVPEALALGAVLSGDLNSAILVAALIALQNLPEGFNAMYEMSETGKSKPSLWLFVLMVPVGPIAAWIGITLPESFAPMIGAVMMFSAGGMTICLTILVAIVATIHKGPYILVNTVITGGMLEERERL